VAEFLKKYLYMFKKIARHFLGIKKLGYLGRAFAVKWGFKLGVAWKR